MDSFISVIIPTHNPNSKRISQTLNGLRSQTLPFSKWELLIVDNCSLPGVQLDLSWHPDHRIISEAKLGLTYARIAGFLTAKGDIIILVDDDNILTDNYLEITLEIFNSNRDLGTAGGKSIPLFESHPPKWLANFTANLAVRDLGHEVIIDKWQNQYPVAAPIGAGMCLRREALQAYIMKVKSGADVLLDRKGNSLSSGGDNDIVIEVLKAGWQTGYFPSLTIHHIIPKTRMKKSYVGRLVYDSSKSWVKLLESHGINPWRKIPVWSVPFRKLHALFVYKAYLNTTNYIKWRGACGLYEALAN